MILEGAILDVIPGQEHYRSQLSATDEHGTIPGHWS
jgi:hypothetical protein